MSILFKRSSAIGLPVACLMLLLLVTAGCGKKAVKTTPAPEPRATVTEAEPQPEATEPAPASPAPAAPVVLENVYFDFDKHHLTPAARDILAKHAVTLQQRPEIPIVIEGHCDERGTIEYNLALGDKRAAAVKSFLISLGIASSRLSTVSYGKERPAELGQNEFAWAKNRRSEFVIKIPASFSEAN